MRDEVVKAAKEAGFRTGTINMAGGAELSFAQPIGISCLVELERFYDLAYNAGLEAAADVCGTFASCEGIAQQCAAAIREMKR